VRNNPKTLTVHFGGRRGRAIRQKYMDLSFISVAADGAVVRQRCFPDINEDTVSHTFSAPGGLLSATQFTQPALTLMEIAAYKDMQMRGLVSDNSSYAGHSLGEYSALCAVADFLPIESLMSIVFYRGLTMQFAVERDEAGRSEFGMCAVNPARLSKCKFVSSFAFAFPCTTCILSQPMNYLTTPCGLK
jgi:fatty acid synthase subunit beta, fungi type